jgi:hypothetical protein
VIDRALQSQLRTALDRIVQREINRAVRDPYTYVKADPTDELRQLLLRFGLRIGVDAGGLQPGTMIQDAIAGKRIRIKWFQSYVDAANERAHAISREAQDRVRESVRVILADAAAAPRRPSLNQVIRRIATTIHSVPRTDGPQDPEKVYVFSFERAALIARTESVQAENTGKMAGFQATGVRRKKWLAFADGRSGDRHHERMNSVIAPIDEPFVTPLGNELMYPGDPSAPIEDTANCRCTMRPA